MNEDDAQLLQRYGREGSEEAFAELVRRRLDLVWGAAWRVTGDSELARDIAQSVFTDLARKSRWISQHPNLPAWLHRAAVLAARKAVRANQRRSARERHAMENHIDPAEPQAQEPSAAVLPLLDEALNQLPQADREALVLRFFAGKTFAQIGESLRVSDDAAQKRLARAIEKLRRYFRKRGVVLNAAALSSLLGAASAQTAPAGLTAAIASTAAAAVSTTAAASFLSFISAAQQQLLFMKTKLLIGSLAAAGVATPLILQQQAIGSLKAELADFPVQAAEFETLRQQNEILAARSRMANELASLRRDYEELLRLQAEADRLRAAAARVTPALRQELEGARAAFETAHAAAAEAQALVAAERLAENTVEAMKNLGLAARIFATDNQDQFPETFQQMIDDELFDPNALPGGVPLDRFEFVQHERKVGENEPSMLLFREKVPRRLPSGEWIRAYTLCDGSVQQVRTPDGNYEEWERPRIAREEQPTKPAQ